MKLREESFVKQNYDGLFGDFGSLGLGVRGMGWDVCGVLGWGAGRGCGCVGVFV